MTLELRRVDLNNINTEELTQVIKDNCIITKKMEQKMEVLQKGRFSKNKIPVSKTPEQTPVLKAQEQQEKNEEKESLKPYIEAFNSYLPEARKEYLQMTEQTISEPEYIRLLVLLQLESARNLIELKEMVTPELGEDDLSYIRDCVTEEQKTRELVSDILKKKEASKIAKVIKRGTLK